MHAPNPCWTLHGAYAPDPYVYPALQELPAPLLLLPTSQ